MQNSGGGGGRSGVRCNPTRPFVEIRERKKIKTAAERTGEKTEVHHGWDLTNRMWVLKVERRRC